jgi:hypothetical protein
MLISSASFAIGAVLGWQVHVAGWSPFPQLLVRLFVAATALFALTYFGPGRTAPAFFGLFGGFSGHAIMKMHLQQRRARQ